MKGNKAKKLSEKQSLILYIISLLLSLIGAFTINPFLMLFIIPAIVFLIKWLKVRKQRLSQEKNNIQIDSPVIISGNKQNTTSKDVNQPSVSKIESEDIKIINQDPIQSTDSINATEKNTISHTSQIDELLIDIQEKNTKLEQEKKKNNFTSDFTCDGVNYILKYTYDNVNIVGSQYIDGADERIKQLNINSMLIISRDEDNSHDAKAAAIYEMKSGNKYKIGYLPKDSNLYNMFNDFYDRDEHVQIRVDENNEGKFKLGFYKIDIPEEYKKIKNNNFESKEFKLTGTTSQSAQDEIEYLSIGDELDIYFDYDKDKWSIVNNSEKIGYLPKNANQYLDVNDCRVFVSKIECNNDFKYSVKVELFMI